MKNFFKGKIATVIILLATFILAGVAIFTAIRLYQLRQQPVAPNVPSSIPQAASVSSCSLSFTLTVGATSTPTPTPTPVPKCDSSCTASSQCPSGLTCYIFTPGTAGYCRNAACLGAVNHCICPTPTPTPVPQCNTVCTSSAGCPSNLTCYIASGAIAGNCRNTACTSESTCICAATPTPTATPTAVPTGTPGATSTGTPGGTSGPTAAPPTLPQSGTNWPTVFGIGVGILTIIGSLLLAL